MSVARPHRRWRTRRKDEGFRLIEEAQALSDRVGIIDYGELIALGTPGELMAKHDRPTWKRVFTSPGAGSRREVKMTTSTKKSIVSTLGILQILIGIGAVPAGYMFIVDPTGASLGFSLESLAGSPFKDYLVPGVFLFTVNGIGSLAGAFLTLRRHMLASPVAVGLGVFLMAWIAVQVIALGPPLHWLQILYFVLGAVELVLGWRLNPDVTAPSATTGMR